MKNSPAAFPRGQAVSVRLAASLVTRPVLRRALGWIVLGAGLAVFIAVQTAFIAGPVWNRPMLPEVDDSYAYLVKTAEMDECFFQDCPALQDLSKQLEIKSSDRDVEWQKYLLEGRIFVIYHPLFSALLLGVKHFVPDLATAYKIVWTAGPTLFGLGFAYWLLTLWGPGPTGIALILLAAKVFPGNGIHYVVPSNIAMSVALFVWARIISRKGDAPWSLMIGTVLMVGMHPLGRIFSAMAIAMALWFSGRPSLTRGVLPLLLSGAVVVLAFAAPAFIARPVLSVPPEPFGDGGTFISEFFKSVLTVLIEVVRFETPMFGSLTLFVGAAVFGYLAVEPAARTTLRRTLLVFAFFLMASLVYVLPAHPADVFFRLSIPFVIVLVGAVGMAIWHTMGQTVDLLARTGTTEGSCLRLSSGWPAVLFAMLAAFGIQMISYGTEGLEATAEYMKNRQPLFLEPEQPDILTSKAMPGNRVMYDNVDVIMPFYFVHGAMKFGAIYYPALKGTPEEQEWMDRSDLRFAVTYSPLVSLPGFQSDRQDQWWISSPEFRYSPLSRPRKTHQISKEGRILTSAIVYMEIRVNETSPRGPLRLLVHNPGDRAWVQGVVLGPDKRPVAGMDRRVDIPAHWSGWIDLGLKLFSEVESLRLDFPNTSRFSIGGLSFGEGALHWPWANKAKLTFMPRGPDVTPIEVKFDPADILPPQLERKNVTVLDDRGCSVLFEIAESK